MVRLTPQQRALVIKTYYENGSSIVETQKKLSSYFGVHYVNKAKQILHALYTLREVSKPGRLRTRRARQNLFSVRENNNENTGVHTTRGGKNLTRILFHPYPTKLQKPDDIDGKESVSSSGENGASISDIDPVRQRLLVDEVGDAVNSSTEITDTSNAIQEIYKESMDCPPHKKSNCAQYLNNSDNIESEVDSSVCNEHLENNIKDYCTLLRTLPTSLAPVENNIRDNKTLLRTILTRTPSHCHSSINISEKSLNSENRFEDEFEAFGKYVAMSLRKMPLSNALPVENQIYSAINSERRLLLLQENKNGINIGDGIKLKTEDEPI